MLYAIHVALPQKLRLSKKKEIERVLGSGKKAVHPFFRLFFYPNKHLYPRFAFIISKKISKKAVDRNRLRRRIVGWLERQELRGMSIDCVILPATTAATISKKELYEHFSDSFHRMRSLISKNSFPKS
jgi:ribonuclease P protein component